MGKKRKKEGEAKKKHRRNREIHYRQKPELTAEELRLRAVKRAEKARK